jgi:chromate reductase
LTPSGPPIARTFLLLAGSFRRGSSTQALSKVVASLLSGHGVVAPALERLPFYSDDLAGDDRPPAVAAFLGQVARADGIVVCTPEYNHGIPAVLKNAVDWASRPAFRSPLRDRPVTFVTQSTSPVGGARAQAHLKLLFDSTLSRIHPCREMTVPNVDQKFDGQGALLDEKTRERLRSHLEDFVRFVG